MGKALDQARAREVARAYESAVRATGGYKFYSVPTLREGQKSFVNAIWLWGFCRDKKISLEEYFKEVLRGYAPDWLIKIFGNPWLPFTMASSRSTWDNMQKIYGIASDEAEEIKTTREILKTYSPEIRKLVLATSFGWVSPKVKEVLRREKGKI